MREAFEECATSGAGQTAKVMQDDIGDSVIVLRGTKACVGGVLVALMIGHVGLPRVV
jgi:hypothetical protein